MKDKINCLHEVALLLCVDETDDQVPVGPDPHLRWFCVHCSLPDGLCSSLSGQENPGPWQVQLDSWTVLLFPLCRERPYSMHEKNGGPFNQGPRLQVPGEV